ncbi:MAG: Sapep family Mn(2+)-dependent dipeptidase [Oscillospiraceae bacterium]|nr:Sapep family Mn(2+)-dependent dipeptidase [Oscillospiraceae bacterium]
MENRDWNAAVDAFIEQHKEDILRDVARLVAVPSVEAPAAPGAPYGPGVRAALDEALAIAAELGLDAAQDEGRIGWADIPGAEPDKYLAVISHVDVVPEGSGWDADPYTLRRREGWLLGRGIVDDKGPAVASLYALKFLKEQAGGLRYPVRALLGCDEETNFSDVAWYLGHHPAPAFCFTPDAVFPLCNGEKGLYEGRFVSPLLENGDILEFEGGVAGNAVADRASALVRADLAKMTAPEGVTLEQEGDFVRVKGFGISGHASRPAGTVNAIGLVVDCLLASGVGTPAERGWLELLHRLHSATDGSGVGIQAADGLFDPLTVIGGVLRMTDGRMTQTIDCRYTTDITGDEITAALRAQAQQAGAELVVTKADKPFYIAPDAPCIRALLDSYTEVTGEDAKPFVLGAATYARYFPLAVSFGPSLELEQRPAFAGPLHGANEGMREDLLMDSLKIYILSLLKLQEVDF